MEKKSDFRSGILWLLAGAAITLLIVVLLKSTTISHAQSSKALSEVGTYQISSFSVTDDWCGYFIMDTRNGNIVNCEIGRYDMMKTRHEKKK